MRELLAAFLIALSVWANPSAWAGSASKRVIITFKGRATAAARDRALAGLRAKRVGSIMSNGNSDDEFVAVVAEVPDRGAAGAAAMDLTGFAGAAAAPAPNGDVVSVEEDYKVKWIESSAAGSFQGTAFPAGVSLGELGLKKFAKAAPQFNIMATRPQIPWGVARVKAPAAWDFTQGAGVRVAVIDTGIDLRHPNLSGKIDGGYDAIDDTEKPGSYQDDNGHGTHVSGTIAAPAGFPGGVVGVAPKARLYAVKVLDSDGSGSLSDVIKGIIWCANNGIQVANMSLGSPMPSEAMHRALKYAKARGVIVVAAAGNSGESVGYPGAYPETIAVAASDWNDQIAAFSSRGPEVRFIAPGVDVVSTMLGGDYASLSGTSMATPHVTGLAALAVSQGYRGLDGPDGVLAQLVKAAKPLSGVDPGDQGSGMIDAGKLVGTSSPALVASLSKKGGR